jgi:predicted outer membrane repeat protein
MRAHAEGNTLNRRIIAILAAIAVLTVMTVAGPLSSPASAATYTVTTAEEFYDAIDAANVATEGGTIYLDNDIVFTASDVPSTLTTSFYTIIDGRGHTMSCADAECDPWLFVELGSDAAELAIVAVTVTGFPNALAVFESNLTVVNATFEDNGFTAAGVIGASGTALSVINSEDPADSADGRSIRDVHLSNVNFIGNGMAGGEGTAIGGAAFIVGDVTIDSGEFTENRVQVDSDPETLAGGGLAIFDSVATITGTRFTDNDAVSLEPQDDDPFSATALGGAISMVDTDLTIDNARFAGNQSSGIGGAISADGGSLNIIDTSFSGSTASYGGALFLNGVFAEISWSEFTDNTAESAGGAVMTTDTGLMVFDSVFTGNDAQGSYGGAIEFDSSEAAVVRSLFADNTAETGGAVEAYQSAVEIEASTFTGNHALRGGAMSIDNAEVHLQNVTLARNGILANSDDEMDGGQVQVVSDGNLYLSQTVIVEPLGIATNCDVIASGDVVSEGFNRADDTTCGIDDATDIGDPSVDAKLGPLQFNGGPTHTLMPAPDSILIDAVTGQDCAAETEDQRGVMKPQGDGCDIGAVEAFAPIYRQVETPGGTVTLRFLNAVSVDGSPFVEAIPVNTLTPAAPAGINFPYGAIGLEIDVWHDGWPVDVDVSTPAPTNQFWKLMWEEWVEYPATQNGLTWSFRLVDGADGDEDGNDNSVILDPIALGAAAAFTG